MKSLQLGLGFLSIGRRWGVSGTEVPSEIAVFELLETAISNTITVFDTAPAYGSSETRLGSFLKKLPATVRSSLTIMTKMGEHWDDTTMATMTDHSRDALIRSIDQSLELLGGIDILQLHKATEDVIVQPDTIAAIEYAKRCGITRFGASVSTVAAGERAIKSGLYSALQFPLNRLNLQMQPLLALLTGKGCTAVINRPYAMGGLVHDALNKDAAGIAAFRFQVEHVTQGIVLSGTGNASHLKENIRHFQLALQSSP